MKKILHTIYDNIKSLFQIVLAMLFWIFILCAVGFAVNFAWELVKVLIKAIFN